jgi:hypothetical protein
MNEKIMQLRNDGLGNIRRARHQSLAVPTPAEAMRGIRKAWVPNEPDGAV